MTVLITRPIGHGFDVYKAGLPKRKVDEMLGEEAVMSSVPAKRSKPS